MANALERILRERLGEPADPPDEPWRTHPNIVRVVTDPDEAARWFATHQPAEVLSEYNPYSKEWMD